MLVLFVTHKWTERIQHSYHQLQLPEGWKKEVLYDESKMTLPKGISASGFSVEQLCDSGLTIPRNKLIPGNCHLPPLSRLLNGNEDHSWIIEYDVHFQGAWQVFLDSFDTTADLLASRVRKRESDPKWYWWHSLSNPTDRRISQFAAFCPIYRISRPAAKIVLQRNREGWLGHQEVIVPTVLEDAGLNVRDFGDKWYRPNTLRWRPGFKPDYTFEDGLLYHPVKD